MLGLNQALGSNRELLLPEQTNLNTWLIQPSTDGKTSVNVKGTDATFTGTNALTFDGSDDFIQANNTGLGAGNFYYETIFKFDWSDANYIVFDGDTVTNNRWFALQYRASSRGLNFVIDGDGTKTTYEIFNSSEVSDNDIVKIVVKREGSTITSQGFNLTQDSSTTDTHTSSSNFSGGNKLTIGALWSGSGLASFSELELYSFKAGISETDLLVHYSCAEGSGNRIFDISGEGNHATNTGATRTTETSSLITSHNNLNGFIKSAITEKSVFSGTNCTGAINADGNLVVTSTADSNVAWTLGFPVQLTGSVTLAYDAVVSDGAGVACNINLNDTGSFWLTSGTGANIPNGSFSATATISSDQDVGLTFNVYSFLTTGQTVTFSNLTLTPSSGACRFPALINKTKQGYTGDGVADEIEFNHSLNASSDFEVESEFIVNDPSLSLQAVFSATGSTTNDRGFFLRYEASSTRWLIKLGDTTYYISSHSIARGDVYKFNLKYHSSTQKVTVTMTKNGTTTTPIDNQAVTHVPDFNGQASLGSLRWSTSSPAGFTFKTCKFIQGTTTNVELDIENSAGLSTVADLSGNGNNGTLQSATLTLNWGKRYVDSNGSIVPANYIQGHTTITNPSGFVHNGSECGLDLITTDVSASDIASINNASATQTFAKRDATNSDLVIQLLQYSSALSDAGELTRTRAYVS